MAAAFSVKKLADFGKKCIELGSDLSEVQNVVDVTFPEMTGKVDEFAKSAAVSFDGKAIHGNVRRNGKSLWIY